MQDKQLWSRGHATPEAIAWAMDLSESERISSLIKLAHLGWTENEQAQFAAIWIVIADRREMALAAAGARGISCAEQTVGGTPHELLVEALGLPSEDLTAALGEFVARFRAGDVFSDQEIEQLGALWAALNIREGSGTFVDRAGGRFTSGESPSMSGSVRG